MDEGRTSANSDDRATPVGDRLPYHPPGLTVLGSVHSLTQNSPFGYMGWDGNGYS